MNCTECNEVIYPEHIKIRGSTAQIAAVYTCPSCEAISVVNLVQEDIDNGIVTLEKWARKVQREIECDVCDNPKEENHGVSDRDFLPDETLSRR